MKRQLTISEDEKKELKRSNKALRVKNELLMQENKTAKTTLQKLEGQYLKLHKLLQPEDNLPSIDPGE